MRINNSQLPSEWQIVSIDKIANKVTDGEHLTPERSESGVLLLSARNVQNGFLSFKEVDYVPEHEYQRIIKRCNPEYRDILISCSGTIGRVCIVPENLKFTLVRSAALIKPGNQVNSDFLGHVLRSSFVQNQISRALNQSAQANLFINHINSLVVPLPPLQEQCEIAEILGVWDGAIDLLEKLIVAKRKLKQGLMQQLLTGKSRFKQFEGNGWKKITMGEIAYIDKKSLGNNTPEDYSFLYISLSDIEDGSISSGLQRLRFSEAPSRARRLVINNDILMATVRPNLKSFAMVKSNADRYVASTGFAVITTKKGCSPDYLYQYIFSGHIEKQINALVTGSNYPAINSTEIKGLMVNCPSLPEQEKIAAVLSAADDEISTLEKQLAAYKEQKRGLMQQLLTGRTRILGLEDGQDKEQK
jgi:type I restriction enzyme, S subunit